MFYAVYSIVKIADFRVLNLFLQSPEQLARMLECLRDRRLYFAFRQRWKSLRHPRPIGEPHHSGNLRPVPPTGTRDCYRACNGVLFPFYLKFHTADIQIVETRIEEQKEHYVVDVVVISPEHKGEEDE